MFNVELDDSRVVLPDIDKIVIETFVTIEPEAKQMLQNELEAAVSKSSIPPEIASKYSWLRDKDALSKSVAKTIGLSIGRDGLDISFSPQIAEAEGLPRDILERLEYGTSQTPMMPFLRSASEKIADLILTKWEESL